MIEIQNTGIICDNEKCDYADETVKVEESLIGSSCPKCGENLLTEEDYQNFLIIEKMAEEMRSYTEEQLIELQKSLEGNEEFENFKKQYGIENAESKVEITINTHNVISIKDVKVVDK